MTRLKASDIAGIPSALSDYDARLQLQTGRSLNGLACLSAGIDASAWREQRAGIKVGVVPFSCGQGVIVHFSDTVAGIINHLGVPAFVAAAADVSGLVDACRHQADMLFMADEDRFVAIDCQNRRVVDNAVMTGRGFASGLALVADGLANKTVLVIGCGKVGRAAAEVILASGGRLAVYDVNPAAAGTLIRQTGGRAKIVPDVDVALMRHDLILDASPAADIIRARHIDDRTCVAAPGMPCGTTAAATEKLGRRLLHDPLQIGVACMLAGLVRMRMERE